VNLIEGLQRPEGKTLEYKRDLSSPGGLEKEHWTTGADRGRMAPANELEAYQSGHQ